jgi:glycosyltransferase involved in cell wall biosynthesis
MKREICMYTPTTTGGHALYTLDLLSALADANPGQELDVSLFTCSDLPSRYRAGLYPIHDSLPPMRPRHDFRSPTLWSFYRQWYFLIRDRIFVQLISAGGHFRAVHFQEYTPWLMSTHFNRLRSAGLHLFYTVHGVYPNKYMDGIPKGVYHKWCRDGWKRCDALFVHTDGLARTLSNFLGEPHPPIFVTPPGISENLADPVKSETSIGAGDPRNLLFFGVIRPTKGLHVLLRALHELPEFRLTIVGDFKEASYKRRIMAEIERLSKEQVNLIDRFVDDDEIPGIFSKSGMLVLPYTFFFAQSGVLRLAVKYGLPVVASDVGGPGESVRSWGTGICVAPGDPKSLAAGIRQMIEPGLYKRARNAVESIRSRLRWKSTAELTWRAYLSIIDPWH